ncbi:MAG: hypothetical protein K8H85_07390 [Cyclobacteriaceae bacterium]|nr:hypothetical protein [Cyclobacteriaceae bacterium]
MARFVNLPMIFVVLLTFQQCTFSPNSEYINPIAPPDPLAVTVEVNNPGFADPFYIIEPTTFRFTVDAPKPVIDYVVTIDGNLVAEGNDRNISFFLFPHSLLPGNHTVNLTIRIATQSGSLADKLNAEYHLIEKNFRLINDPTPPPNVTATASYENGYLTVRWNTSSKKNFYYVIKRTYSPYDPLSDTVIRNPSQNVFVDRGYVGGDINYKIAVSGFGFDRHVLGTVSFNDNPVDFVISEGADKTARLSWTNSLIDVTNTNLKIDAGSHNIIMPLTLSNDLVIDTLVLGEQRNYWIDTYRTGYQRQRYRRIIGIESPLLIKPFITQAMMPVQNKLLTLTSKAIYRYALPSLILEDSLLTAGDGDFSGIAISGDGNRAVLLTKNWNLYGFDPLSFETPLTRYGLFIATIPATNGNSPLEKVVLGNLSDNGLVTMVLSKNGGKSQAVFDIVNNVVPWSAPKFIYLNITIPPVISSNGLYLANDYPAKVKADIYKWSGSTFDKIGTTDAGRKYFRLNSSELFNGTYKEYPSYIAQGDVKIYDINTPPAQPDQPLTVLREMHFNSLIGDEYFWELRYDDYTQLFYSRYMENVYSTLRLYDVNSMSYIGSLKAFTYTPYSHEFANGFHFSNRGYIEQQQ